ncbi:MAG: helix-turn-helix domain-containing protein [Thermomicrobiales bacterium]|uniref:helix-turn-helix domain-containing protein n=1 Tax=Pseudorhodoplanes sp. TaxID=1934341 RepID=UPI003D0CEDB5
MAKSVYTDAQGSLVAILVAARKESGLRQADLAERVGKDQSYISNIERGQRRVDLVEFRALASAMNVDPVVLFKRWIEQVS